MHNVVSNATPLIYLAKIGKLELLKFAFEEVVIPQEVKAEVVDKGKLLKEKDASIVENAIKEGWLKVLTINSTLEMPMALDRGEEAVLSLAKKLGCEVVIIDEVVAREAAKLLGLTPRGTLFVLLTAFKKGKISLDEFLDLLDKLIYAGFRLKEEVYLQVIKEAQKIAQTGSDVKKPQLNHKPTA